jgi:hypothetical protein
VNLQVAQHHRLVQLPIIPNTAPLHASMTGTMVQLLKFTITPIYKLAAINCFGGHLKHVLQEDQVQVAQHHRLVLIRITLIGLVSSVLTMESTSQLLQYTTTKLNKVSPSQ